MRRVNFSCAGFVALGLVVVVLLLFGSVISLHTAAIISSGSQTRALEMARQHASLSSGLEQLTRETFHRFNSDAASFSTSVFSRELRRCAASYDFGAYALESVEVSGAASGPCGFPGFGHAPARLGPPSLDFSMLATPRLRHSAGDLVSESSTFRVQFTVSRTLFAGTQRYLIPLDCRIVSVPVTRFPVLPYDRLDEIGSCVGIATPPSPNALEIASLGLTPYRDPADSGRLNPDAALVLPGDGARPTHYRHAAEVAATLDRTFSDAGVQRFIDSAGVLRFIKLGDAGNPTLAGGEEEREAYRLDLGRFGEDAPPHGEGIPRAVVFCASSPGQRLVLHDSTGGDGAVAILALGWQRGVSPGLVVRIEGPISRPVLIVAAHARIEHVDGATINGALILDPHCDVSASAVPLSVGHVSYWSGGTIEPSQFRHAPLPSSVAELAPRTLFLATGRRSL